MSLFWKREKGVQGLIQEYFAASDAAVEAFRDAMKVYFDAGRGDEFTALDKRIHEAESQADDLRVKIEVMLYRRALLPESRGDILGLLENFDRMPNLIEYITFVIDTEALDVPAAFRQEYQELVAVNLEAYRAVRTAVDLLFSNPDGVIEAIKPVDHKESESDRMERDLIRAIFRSDALQKAEMILLRDLVKSVGDISDAAERVGHRLQILSLKKRI